MNTSNWAEIYCPMLDNKAWGNESNIITIKTEVAPGCLVPDFECGQQSSFTGGESFPTIYNINLGSGTGVVTLTFDAIGIPDKFIVKFGGVEVINTGYRGQTAYQSQLDAELTSRGLPTEIITAPPSGTATFNKTTSSTTAQLIVYAPLTGTGWNATLSCPV